MSATQGKPDTFLSVCHFVTQLTRKFSFSTHISPSPNLSLKGEEYHAGVSL
jgi:hypothetical protein